MRRGPLIQKSILEIEIRSFETSSHRDEKIVDEANVVLELLQNYELGLTASRPNLVTFRVSILSTHDSVSFFESCEVRSTPSCTRRVS